MREEPLNIFSYSHAPHSVFFASIFVNECRKNMEMTGERNYKHLFVSKTTQKEIYNILNKNGKKDQYIDFLGINAISNDQKVMDTNFPLQKCNVFNKRSTTGECSIAHFKNSISQHKRFSPVLREMKKPLRKGYLFKGPRRFVSITEGIQRILF